MTPIYNNTGMHVVKHVTVTVLHHPYCIICYKPIDIIDHVRTYTHAIYSSNYTKAEMCRHRAASLLPNVNFSGEHFADPAMTYLPALQCLADPWVT